MEGNPTRQLDDLGRIVVPADIRESLGWGSGTRLEVMISDITVKTIILREVSPCCTLCRANVDDLIKVEKGYVCPACVEQLMEKYS